MSCHKQGYRREAEAHAALRECQRKGRAEASYYRCRACRVWHLTSLRSAA